MGTSKSPAEFSRKIRQLATVTQARQKIAINEGALTAKQIILAEAASRGVKPTSKIAKGRWGVRYDVKGFNNPTALVRIYGAFHLVDRPTKAHRIGPRRGRRSSGKRAVAFDGNVKAYTQHPGTAGKGIFPVAKLKASKAVPIVMSQRIISGWRAALK